MVDLRRFELPTPTMRMWCAPSCATSPCLQILPYYSAFRFQSQAKASAVFSLFSATGMFLPCLYPMVHYAVPPEASVLRRILTRFPRGIIIKNRYWLCSVTLRNYILQSQAEMHTIQSVWEKEQDWWNTPLPFVFILLALLLLPFPGELPGQVYLISVQARVCTDFCILEDLSWKSNMVLCGILNPGWSW